MHQRATYMYMHLPIHVPYLLVRVWPTWARFGQQVLCMLFTAMLVSGLFAITLPHCPLPWCITHGPQHIQGRSSIVLPIAFPDSLATCLRRPLQSPAIFFWSIFGEHLRPFAVLITHRPCVRLLPSAKSRSSLVLSPEQS